MCDTHMNPLLRHLWTGLVFCFLFGFFARAAEEPRTFILDTSFRIQGPDGEVLRGGRYWNPPFIGGARVALMGNGQMVVTRTPYDLGASGLLRVNANGSVDGTFAPEIPPGGPLAVAVDAEANVYTDRKSTRLNSGHGYISYAV